jgi:hypothetical protein
MYRYLNLCENRLTGGVPSQLPRMALLSGLGLGDNLLTGRIPSELGDMYQLTRLVGGAQWRS